MYGFAWFWSVFFEKDANALGSLPCSAWISRVSFLDMLAVISVNLISKKAPVQSLSTLNSVL